MERKEIVLDETMTNKVIAVFTDITASLRTEVYQFIVEQANANACSFASIIRAYVLIDVKRLNERRCYKAFNTFVSRNFRKSQGKYIALTKEEKKANKAAADKAAGKITSAADPAPAAAAEEMTVSAVITYCKATFATEDIERIIKALNHHITQAKAKAAKAA